MNYSHPSCTIQDNNHLVKLSVTPMGTYLRLCNSKGRYLKRLNLGSSLSDIRRALTTTQRSKLYRKPIIHVGSHTCVIPQTKGIIFTYNHDTTRHLKRKPTIFLNHAIIQQILSFLNSLYQPSSVSTPLEKLRQEFYQALYRATNDKDLEIQGRNTLRNLGYTVPRSFDRQKGQVWLGKVYFDFLGLSEREVIFGEAKFHHSNVATEEIENFSNRLNQVADKVGTRNKIAIFLSKSPISKKGFAIMKNVVEKKLNYSVLVCVLEWNR